MVHLYLKQSWILEAIVEKLERKQSDPTNLLSNFELILPNLINQRENKGFAPQPTISFAEWYKCIDW